jgi:hypothetical protein
MNEADMTVNSTETAVSVPQAFSINDAAAANWLVRKIVEARAYAAHVQAWAAAEIRRAENEQRYYLDRYGSQLEGWARAQLALKNTKRRSIPLPAGTIGFRSLKPHLLVIDPTALLGWCYQHLAHAVCLDVHVTGLDAVQLKQWLRQNCPKAETSEITIKSLLNEHFRASGDLPSGTECASGERFFIK